MGDYKFTFRAVAKSSTLFLFLLISSFLSADKLPLNSFSATTFKCLPASPDTDQMIDYLSYQKFFDVERTQFAGGLVFKNQSRILVDSLLGLIKGANTGLFKEAECLDPYCALRQRYNARTSSLLLYLASRFGILVGTPFSTDNPLQFSETELELILLVAESLPKDIFPRHGFTRIVLSKTPFSSGPQAVVPAQFLDDGTQLILYPAWRSLSEDNKAIVLLHELAHYIDNRLGLSNSESWKRATGWNETLKRKGLIVPKTWREAPTEYALQSEQEDFAESFVIHRMGGKLSQARSDFISQNLFHNQDQRSTCDFEIDYQTLITEQVEQSLKLECDSEQLRHLMSNSYDFEFVTSCAFAALNKNRPYSTINEHHRWPRQAEIIQHFGKLFKQRD